MTSNDGKTIEVAVKTVDLAKVIKNNDMSGEKGFQFSGISFISQVDTNTVVERRVVQLNMLENEKTIGFDCSPDYGLFLKLTERFSHSESFQKIMEQSVCYTRGCNEFFLLQGDFPNVSHP